MVCDLCMIHVYKVGPYLSKSYHPYEWPHKWVTRIITVLIEVISPQLYLAFVDCSLQYVSWIFKDLAKKAQLIQSNNTYSTVLLVSHVGIWNCLGPKTSNKQWGN